MYKITITKEETVDKVGREYEKLADSGNKEDNGAVYGYVEYLTTEINRVVILEQSLEELDLSAVVKAVNKF